MAKPCGSPLFVGPCGSPILVALLAFDAVGTVLSSAFPSFGGLPTVGGDAIGTPDVIPAVKLYDCQAEIDIWEWAWTPEWKAWCCSKEAVGCPPTSTTITRTKTLTSTTITSTTATSTTATTTTQTATSTTATTTSVTSTTGTTTTATTTSTITSTSTATSTGTTTTRSLTETRTVTATSTSTVSSTSTHTATETSTQTETTTVSFTQTETSITATATVTTITTTTTTLNGCQKECAVLGETATCASRISWTEMHVTSKESAPCPAAHVVVMSQCEACGECQFKDVKCISQRGISKSDYEDEFMYRKYEESANLESSHEVALLSKIKRHSFTRGLLLLGIAGSATTALTMGLIRWRRRGFTRPSSMSSRDLESFVLIAASEDSGLSA